MCAWQALLIPGFCRISEMAEDLREEAFFGILGAGLAQVFAHFGFADMNRFGHG